MNKIYKNSINGNLRTVIPPITIPAMPAFYTGKNPAKIGLFSHTKADLSIPLSYDIKGKKLWNYLNDAGKRCLLFNLPLTYPPQKLNGVLITGYPTPSYKKNIYTYPPGLSRKINFPEDIMVLEGNKHKFTLSDKKEILQKQIEITTKRYSIIRDICHKNNFDLSIFFIKGTDMLQHLIWDKKDYLLEYYKLVDDIIGKWIELNKDYNIFIISDHGFDSYPKFKFHINSWLEREGFLKYKDRYRDKLLKNMFNVGKRILPLKTKYLLNEKILKPNTQGESVVLLDMKKTTAFRDRYGIRINNKKEYDEIRTEIIEKLKSMQNENEKIVKEIYKREDLYAGEYIEEIPDIVLLLNKNFILAQSSPNKNVLFTNVKEKEQYGYGAIRTGVHDSSINGIFFAFGPDIDNKKRISNTSLLDITPTILHMFRLPIPDDIDGRVLIEIFRADSTISKRIVEKTAKDSKVEFNKNKLSKKDEYKIRNKLKMLGYLD